MIIIGIDYGTGNSVKLLVISENAFVCCYGGCIRAI